MTGKDILECVQCSKSIIDTDSDGENASPILKSSKMRNIMKKKIQRVKTGGPRTLQRRKNRQRKPQRRNHQREVVNEINSSSEMRKTVKINGYDFDALIDTRFAHNILIFFFRCGQLIFRMADCEVKALLQAPLASPRGTMSPTGERSDEGTSELKRIRWDRKRGRRASAEQ
ncbi:hypothetical protein TNCV_1859741 [Trichonephila clavipes]|nr:hypothetical protein TNCV_1859741 [Trichonephila clavipes]